MSSIRVIKPKINASLTGIILQFIYTIVPLLTLVFVQEFSIFHFSALNVGNRVFGAVVVALFVSEVFLYLVNRISPPVPAIVLISYFFLMSLYGYALGNGVLNIISDLVLLLSPLAFYIYGARQRRRSIWYEDFASDATYGYFFTAVLLFVFVFAPANLLLGTEQARSDFPMMIGMYLVFLFRGRAIVKLLSFLGLIFTVFASGYKLALLLVLVDLVIMFLVWVFSSVNIVIKFTRALTVFVLGTIIILFLNTAIMGAFASTTLAQNTLLRKIRDFSSSVRFSISNAETILDTPFEVLDPSTAERVYELKQTVSTNIQHAVTILFGQGLGGTVDLSGTQDPGIIQTYNDVSKVRVVHLGLTWAFLKGGIVGLLIYFVFLFRIAKYAFRLLSNQGGIWQGIGLVLINYLFGVNIVFGYWIKTPLLGVMLGWKVDAPRKISANHGNSRGNRGD